MCLKRCQEIQDLGKKMIWKDVACEILSIFIPEDSYRMDRSHGAWHGSLPRPLQYLFFACCPPDCTIFFTCISRTSIPLIAKEKQYSRTVCCNPVMRRNLLGGKTLFPCSLCECFVHHCSGKLSDNNQGWTRWPSEVLLWFYEPNPCVSRSFFSSRDRQLIF